jgi:hypothetical protein
VVALGVKPWQSHSLISQITFLNEPQMRPYTYNSYLVGFEVLTAVIMFWDITPCSPLKFNRRFGGTYRLHLQGRWIRRVRNQRESSWLVSCPAYTSTLKTEAMWSTETSVDFQRTTRR